MRADLETGQASAAELKAALESERASSAELRAMLQSERKSSAELASLRAQVAQGELELTRTRADLTELRAGLPTFAGGVISTEQIQSEAVASLEALRALHQKRGAMEKDAWQTAREELEGQIRQKQYLLVQSVSAKGLYLVRSGDTLNKISRLVYGKANEWTRIYEANRYLLDDPNRVFPGMTLIIP